MAVVQVLLVIGERVNGGHNPGNNIEMIMNDLCHWGQAVGCTAGIRDNWLGRIICVLVNPHYNHLGVRTGSGNNNFFGTGFQMHRCSIDSFKFTGGINNNIRTKFTPLQIFRVSVAEQVNRFAIDDQMLIIKCDITLVAPMGGIKFKEARRAFRIRGTVDSNNFNIRMLHGST